MRVVSIGARGSRSGFACLLVRVSPLLHGRCVPKLPMSRDDDALHEPTRAHDHGEAVDGARAVVDVLRDG